MPIKPIDDWAVESARDLRLDLYEPQALVLEEPPNPKSSVQQTGWKETKLHGNIESHLMTALQQSLGRNLDLVIADKAGSGKTVTSLRIQNLLSDQNACERIFSDHRIRLVIHWTTSRLPNPGVTHPTLMQMLMADPVLTRIYPNNEQRKRAIEYASTHERLVIIVDGYDELTDDSTSFNRTELIDGLYRNPDSLSISWIFTGRTHAIDEAYRFNRLFQVESFVRFSLCEFDEETQNRYMAKATRHIISLRGIRWRDSLEHPDAGWNELLGLPYTLREIARGFDEAAPSVPKWSSPSDLFCQTSQNMLRRELEKPANQAGLQACQISDMDEAIGVAERTLGAIALELASQGIRKEVIASRSQDQAKMIRALVASAETRFANSCVSDGYKVNDSHRLWAWSYDFVGKFILHNGSTQAYVTSTSLGFTTQRILEMWAARYITTYASELDLRDMANAKGCALGHNGDRAWTNLWECAIRMSIQSDDKPYGVDAQRYLLAMKLLFERPIQSDQRRPTELMWQAEQWLWNRPILRGMVAELHRDLAAQFRSLKEGGESSYSSGIKELLNPENYVLLCSPNLKRSDDLGSFKMGPDWRDQRTVRVTFTKPFAMARYTLTRGQVRCWDNGFEGDEARLAATELSWYDSYYFCRFLGGASVKLKDGKEYWFSLPTEAQWEYACRAGYEGDYGFNGGEKELPKYAWFRGNKGDPPREGVKPVGTRDANRWGLHDMHGNVWEHVWDWYGEYPEEPQTDPVGPSTGSDRVNRGGGWDFEAANCRSANRDWNTPENRDYFLGFRVALVPVASAELKTSTGAGGQE